MGQGDAVNRGFLLVLLAATWLPAAGRRKPRPHPPKPPARTQILHPQAIASFLDALARPEARQGQTVRVLQFGDSHTAADYWTGRVRSRLQARFGDGGPGCILPARPWRGYPHEGVRILAGQTWAAQCLRSSECDGWVGLTGASLAPVSGETFVLKAAFGEFRVHLLGPGGVAVGASLTLADEALPGDPPAPVPLVSSDPLQEDKCLEIFAQTVPAGGGPRRLALTLPEGSRLLGVDLLSGAPGVIYDELGVNGAELLDLDRWNPWLRRSLLARVHPDLIVLAYGTNDMGMSTPAQASYQASVRKLLLALKDESGAPILVVGPLDRLGSKRRQRAALKAGAAFVVSALKDASREAGCAFWDARQSMGGYGSMLKWRRAGMAQKDLVHLNGAGYQRLGDQMADALLEAMARRRR
jgi:lysophospholipase L1-like esterase